MNNPLTCVWEITMACNMRCKHCGSICTTPLPGELTTEESLKFIDMCAEIGMNWISISGGEPFLRKDLIEIIKYANLKNISINIISNGWFINDYIAKELSNLKYVAVFISLDGPEYIHDFIRKKGSFNRSKESFKKLNYYGVPTGCITTVVKKNIDELEILKNFLINENVKYWQLQIGFPMGTLSDNRSWILDPIQVNDLIKYCYYVSNENKIKVFPADCVGYYDNMQNEILKKSFETENIPEWEGCSAGKYSFGLLHNGDVVGCTSIRDKKFVEGNIKEKSLKEIWENPKSFSWNRNFKKEDLKGDCLKCRYADKCLGGCQNSRFSMNGTIYSENLYCLQNLKIKNLV